MTLIKKIDIYILKRFLLLFVMTFLICIFILLMQFLWKHFTELIGKGISISVLSEFFLYAILTLVPMALPLAILLASLMAFGNLGETFELTAMKAAGISLFRIIRPLIIFISLLCVGAFFFSNNVLPYSQTKLYTLILSLKIKSPELDIPQGEFYNGINGVNIYVREKKEGLLKNLMIYDFSSGFDNAQVTVADSGRLSFTKDKKYVMLALYNGESFENLRKQRISSSSSSVPYRRETFALKEVLLDFNSDFNRLNDSILKDQHLSKNIVQLSHSIDSVSKIVTTKGNEQSKELIRTSYFGRDRQPGKKLAVVKDKKNRYNADSLFLSLKHAEMIRASEMAMQSAQRMKDQIGFNKVMLEDPTIYLRRHEIEWNRKFTLSFACLIFFFIGAPLGSIIRKGGLGMPVVISVVMFIIYYIIDNTGYKMAREGIWSSYQGMWLSSMVLLPIGIFLTYKAVVDATLFNPEMYVKAAHAIKKYFNKLVNRSADEVLEET